MSNATQQAQLVANRLQHLAGKIAALEAKNAAGTMTPGESNFLRAFERQLGEVAIELVQARIASGEWRAAEIIRRMS